MGIHFQGFYKDRISKRRVEIPKKWNLDDIYLCEETIDALEGSIGVIEYGIDYIFKETNGEDGASKALLQ